MGTGNHKQLQVTAHARRALETNVFSGRLTTLSQYQAMHTGTPNTLDAKEEQTRFSSCDEGKLRD